MRVIIIILALAVAGPGDAKKKGRRGNALYVQEEYVQAASIFRDGVLEVQEKGPGEVHAGLLNNLGASLFRQGEFEQAASAFASSQRMAPNLDGVVRANYNAGNAAVMQEELESALEHYKSALLSDPNNENAKFNYEFVKRQLEEQQQQQQDQENQDQESDEENQNQDQEQDSEQEQQQDQDQEQQQNPEQEQDPNEQPNEPQEQPNPDELSEEEAERILQALENEEEQLLRQIQKMKTRPRRVEKDW